MSMIAPPTLAPLRASAQYDETEDQIKQLTLEIFSAYFREYERDINAYGAPHLGSFELVERWIKADGLAMVRTDAQDAMRYLFKAWRARNPKRGLHFLQTYPQLLWPGGATAEQMWHDKRSTYPYALARASEIQTQDPSESHYLTSRVLVEVDGDDDDGRGLANIRQALRSILGAKFLLLCRLLKTAKTECVTFAFVQISQHIQTSGDCKLPDKIESQADLGILALENSSGILRTSSRV